MRTLKFQTPDGFRELGRKLIHISSLWIVILAYYATKEQLVGLLCTICICVLIFEYARLSQSQFALLVRLKRLIRYSKIDLVLRDNEAIRVTGATYMLLSALLCSLFASKWALIFALITLIISDPAAAFVGLNFGKHKIFRNKTIEGSIAFFLTSLCIALLMQYYFFLNVTVCPSMVSHGKNLVIGAIIATISELCSNALSIDDNFLVPLSVCAYLSS